MAQIGKCIVLCVICASWILYISCTSLYHDKEGSKLKEDTLSKSFVSSDDHAYRWTLELRNIRGPSKVFPKIHNEYITEKMNQKNFRAATVKRKRAAGSGKQAKSGIKIHESDSSEEDKLWSHRQKNSTTQEADADMKDELPFLVPDFEEKAYGGKAEDTFFSKPAVRTDLNKNEIQKTMPEKADSKTSSGIATWVFITIGVAVVILVAATLTLTLVYRRRKLALQQERLNRKPPDESAAGLIYDTQRSGSTDRGTERTRTTVSTYLSKDSREDEVECVELMPLNAAPTKERAAIPEVFRGESIYDDSRALSSVHVEREWEPPLPRVKVINSAGTGPQTQSLLGSCMGGGDREDDGETVVSSRSFFSTMRDDGNKLRGGNGDFHRRYVDVDYVHNDTGQQRYRHRKQHGSSPDYDRRRRSAERKSFPSSPDSQPGIYRSCRDRGRNESNASSSTSHHSARSYISIPPTSPSENYIEAGSDDLSMRSERSTPPIRMEWLTKSLKVDAKNELSNYQANSGTQTDSDVSGPKFKTVFGTSWQFGGTFTNRGGVMQAKDSDVSLVVVANAIPKGEYMDIYGAVFTDTTEIRRKFDFPADESLITPVVEYHAEPTHPFSRPVCVQLPHALPEDFDSQLIKVYTFSVDERGRVTMRCLPMGSRSNDERVTDGHWEKGSDGYSIEISTMHFSGYFCTMCETYSLPSICTMVFGSHVQITPSRREVRVILYIWDRRLTIKDYLERFRKQESDVDRQLLTDMQVPLLDSASSDSRLVMRMEVMGEDNDRECWRHVYRPDGSRPLFKPLQVRKLSEIVHCCRQTDPIRVEWALENVPQYVPSTVLQCCIDIMHVHESTRDYETAMREDNDDLMRTFYVRDLKVLTHSPQDMKPSPDFQRVDLKRTLSETLDRAQTERVCQEYGITNKDIGNFRKKYTSEEKFQLGLVEECMRRHGEERFIQQLPVVLEKLSMSRALAILEDKKVLVRDLAEFEGNTSSGDPSTKRVSETTVLKQATSSAADRDNTRRKSPYRERSSSPRQRRRSVSPQRRRQSREDQRRSQKPDYHQQVSERSDDVFMHNQPQPRQLGREERQSRSRDRGTDSKNLNNNSQRPQRSPPCDYDPDEAEQVSYRDSAKNRYAGQVAEERQPLRAQKGSSNGSDSVLRDSSISSRDNNMVSGFSSRSTLGYSMLAQTDPKDFAEPYPEEFLDEFQKQTYKKEIAVQQNLHGPYVPEDTGLHLSDSGPQAIPPGSRHQSSSSSSTSPYTVVPSQPKASNNKNQQSPDPDQTSKKELYGLHTIV